MYISPTKLIYRVIGNELFERYYCSANGGVGGRPGRSVGPVELRENDDGQGIARLYIPTPG